MAIYLSMHIIACMTRQALNQLIATMEAAQEIRFIRACASQMAGRLLCEFDAPDQDALLRFLDQHYITYEWIIREELTWGQQQTADSSADAAQTPVAPPASSTGQEIVPQSMSPATPETHAEASATEHVGSVTTTHRRAE